MRAIPKLVDISSDRNNNLNLIRMIAASAVLISHSYPISLGQPALEPLEKHIGMTLGDVAVDIFFVLSGFLVSMSYTRCNSLYEFFTARVSRIFPGLFVVLIVTIFVLGPAVTAFPLVDYFFNNETILYVPRNLSLAFLQYDLPGVFDKNPLGPAINGSLWTLFYEVACYVGVVLIGALGVFQSNSKFYVLSAVFLVLYFSIGHFEDRLPIKVAMMAKLGFPFFVGVVFFKFRESIPVTFLLACLLIIISFTALDTIIFREIFHITIGYLLLCVGFLRKFQLPIYNRLGDYSYGTYIYAFPVQQLYASYLSPMSPELNMIVSIPITILFAILSWHFVESKALSLRRKLHVKK